MGEEKPFFLFVNSSGGESQSSETQAGVYALAPYKFLL